MVGEFLFGADEQDTRAFVALANPLDRGSACQSASDNDVLVRMIRHEPLLRINDDALTRRAELRCTRENLPWLVRIRRNVLRERVAIWFCRRGGPTLDAARARLAPFRKPPHQRRTL